MTPAGEPVSLWWTLPLAVLGSALAALIIGFFVVRTHGIYFIMVTMAFAQMVFYLFFDNKALGGSDGIYVNFKPHGIGGFFDLDNKLVFYYFTLACLLGVYFFCAACCSARSAGRWRASASMSTACVPWALAPLATSSAPSRWRALAGLAGYLWGAQSGYVNPELMGFHMSAHAIMMVILGGMGNFAGAIVGAFAFEYVLHVFKDLPTVGAFRLGKHWQLWMGLFIVLLVVFAPRGILGLAGKLLQRKGEAR
jgi:branched-chain amino acid transport system permease protein